MVLSAEFQHDTEERKSRYRKFVITCVDEEQFDTYEAYWFDDLLECINDKFSPWYVCDVIEVHGDYDKERDSHLKHVIAPDVAEFPHLPQKKKK